jgi:hypothetical protein
MRDILEDFLFANGPRARDPNSALSKFMTNVAPYIPTTLFVLGFASTAIGVCKLIYVAQQSNVYVYDYHLLLPWGLVGIVLLLFAAAFFFFESNWWNLLSLNAQKRLLELPPPKTIVPPQPPRPFGPLQEVYYSIFGKE